MLEIKNVSKTYRPKKGVPVKALNDVSVKFADTGMVFILGKSGSGKSTLLNVLGGLDQADCGEFVIKGKSSKDFSQSDFDSYRNTFVGFIFQEYNILPEFTVGANIALAMELQGKKADNQSLNALLDEVDLTGYGNRKPNELSGGQKQRVAIARALIKSPEIIMADEPTGALDSRTGIQVMDTLKKLSKTKLVLVVSHDRDFAEQYGDRIIELKDGKIISDTTKTNVAPNEVNEGLSVLDDGLLRVKKGYTLTQADLNIINEYLSKADSDTFISTDGKANEDIKQAVGIGEDGCKEKFESTQEDNIKIKQYSKEESKLIRSRLPYKNSLKIGASSLKSKPFRLVMTILLCIVAFTMFGLVDTISAYDSNVVLKQSVKYENIDHASFVKYYVPDDAMYGEQSLKLNDNDLAKIKQDTGIDLIPVFTGLGWDRGFSFDSALYEAGKLASSVGINYYNSKVSGLANLNQSLLQTMGYALKGRLPQNDDEITISQYMFEHFDLAGINYYDADKDKAVSLSGEDITSFEDVEGKIIVLPSDWGLPTTIGPLGLSAYKIVGLFDTDLKPNEKYSRYMPKTENSTASTGSMMDMINSQELDSMLNSGLHAVVGVTQNTMNKAIDYAEYRYSIASVSVGKTLGSDANIFFMASDGSGGFSRSSHIATLEQMKNYANITWVDGEKTTLSDGEVIVPFNTFNMHNRCVSASTINALEEAGYVISDGEKENLLHTDLSQFIVHDAQYVNTFAHLCKLTVADVPQAFRNSDPYFESLPDEEVLQYYQNYLRERPYDSAYGKRGVDFYNEFLSVIYRCENATSDYLPYGTFSFSNSVGKAPENIAYSIVGYYIPNADYPEVQPSCPLIVSSYVYDGFEVPEVGYYGYAVGKMPLDNNAELDELLRYAKTTNNNIKYSLSNQASFLLDQVDGLIKPLSQVFLYVGIGLAVFASLMMFNFISVSISYKKREIGILRAVGARSSDVFGIFFNESMIITIINWVLASVATVSIVFVLNNMLRTQYGLVLTLLNVSIRQIALLLAIGVAVAFVSSFIPVMNIARKRPIDAIQNR